MLFVPYDPTFFMKHSVFHSCQSNHSHKLREVRQGKRFSWLSWKDNLRHRDCHSSQPIIMKGCSKILKRNSKGGTLLKMGWFTYPPGGSIQVPLPELRIDQEGQAFHRKQWCINQKKEGGKGMVNPSSISRNKNRAKRSFSEKSSRFEEDF